MRTQVMNKHSSTLTGRHLLTSASRKDKAFFDVSITSVHLIDADIVSTFSVLFSLFVSGSGILEIVQSDWVRERQNFLSP